MHRRRRRRRRRRSRHRRRCRVVVVFVVVTGVVSVVAVVVAVVGIIIAIVIRRRCRYHLAQAAFLAAVYPLSWSVPRCCGSSTVVECAPLLRIVHHTIPRCLLNQHRGEGPRSTPNLSN